MNRSMQFFTSICVIALLFGLSGGLVQAKNIKGTWSATGSMSFTRDGHTATLLSDGKVLVAGGRNASAELYDPSTGTWSATGSMSFTRDKHTATLLSDGKVLVAGGLGNPVGNPGSTKIASAELYDPSTGTWSVTGSMSAVRAYHSATLLPDDKVLVAGGFLESAELYDPSTGTWSVTGSMNTSRTGHTATFLSNGKVLVTGGENTSSFLASAELYDPSTGTWLVTGSMNTSRTGYSLTLLPDGKVLVAGGVNDTRVLASVELYDPGSGTWSVIGSMSTPRGFHTATLLSKDKEVLVAGGIRDTTETVAEPVELYTLKKGTWSTTGSMTTPRFLHTATLLSDDSVLVAGGFGVGDLLTSTEFYTP